MHLQLHVYRPLVERADSIDRQRAEAEEGLRATEAELGRERASLAASKRDAKELQAALDRRGARLAEAEAEVSLRVGKGQGGGAIVWGTHRNGNAAPA